MPKVYMRVVSYSDARNSLKSLLDGMTDDYDITVINRRGGAGAVVMCLAQYTYWQGQDRKTLRRINLLLEATAREPYQGIGKPEALLGNFSGYWSRRIDDTHRLVYRATVDTLVVVGCRYCQVPPAYKHV